MTRNWSSWLTSFGVSCWNWSGAAVGRAAVQGRPRRRDAERGGGLRHRGADGARGCGAGPWSLVQRVVERCVQGSLGQAGRQNVARIKVDGQVLDMKR